MHLRMPDGTDCSLLCVPSEAVHAQLPPNTRYNNYTYTKNDGSVITHGWPIPGTTGGFILAFNPCGDGGGKLVAVQAMWTDPNTEEA